MNDESSRLFLFLGQMGMGGIETLQLKVANELVRRGRRVAIGGKEGELLRLLSPKVQALSDPTPRAVLAEMDRMSARDLTLVSMHPWELLRASMLNRALSRRGFPVRGFHLVTHSRAFFFDTRLPAVLPLLKRALFASPVKSTYFMNRAARDAHQAYWATDLSDHPILTLPLAPPTVAWNRANSGALRIGSVGRLVPFKGYNRAAPEVVRWLRDKGIEASWDIWGDGPEQPEIERAIEAEGAAEWLRLKGPLPYERFDETVASYDLFVGMGTALLEAARLGMPAITAVEATAHETYGYLSEAPLDSVGDRVAGAPTRDLEDLIAGFSRLSASERMKIGESCRASALQRSSSVEGVADAIEQSRPWRLTSSALPWLTIGSLLLRIQDFRKLAATPAPSR